jgi:outer membrane protein OmpA-like peptidoglycan-associated protein
VVSKQPVSAAPFRVEASRVRLEQVKFGRESTFGACAEPACPQVTPKTLAATEPPSAIRPIQHRPEMQVEPVTLSRHPAVPTSRTEPTAPSDDSDTRLVVVTFASGSAQLTAQARAKLADSAALARASERIVIQGRTDSTGDRTLNESLALARAVAVRDFIREAVPDLPNTIGINAKGNCCFAAPNDTRDGRAKNRRAEVAFSLMEND